MLKLKAILATGLGILALGTSVPASAGYVQIYRDLNGTGGQMGYILYCEDTYTVINIGGTVSGGDIAPAEYVWVDTWEQYGC